MQARTRAPGDLVNEPLNRNERRIALNVDFHPLTSSSSPSLCSGQPETTTTSRLSDEPAIQRAKKAIPSRLALPCLNSTLTLARHHHVGAPLWLWTRRLAVPTSSQQPPVRSAASQVIRNGNSISASPPSTATPRRPRSGNAMASAEWLLCPALIPGPVLRSWPAHHPAEPATAEAQSEQLRPHLAWRCSVRLWTSIPVCSRRQRSSPFGAS